MSEPFKMDAYSPRDVAGRLHDYCVAKVQLPLLPLVMLGVLAGAFIGFGALMYTLVASDESLGFAASRLLCGLSFSLGLVLVSVAGAELFTGNCLLAMAWADGRITARQVLTNWAVVLVGNFIGCIGMAVMVWLSGQSAMNDGNVARAVIHVATTKAHLPLVEAFFRGILCNTLVCLASWMALAGRSLVDKAVAIVLPITAFVAAGFEHAIANLYLIPLAMLLGAPLTALDLLHNIVPVLAGNIVGGSVFVALVYYVVYGRGPGAAGGRGHG
jgi:formate/nitrite transporter